MCCARGGGWIPGGAPSGRVGPLTRERLLPRPREPADGPELNRSVAPPGPSRAGGSRRLRRGRRRASATSLSATCTANASSSGKHVPDHRLCDGRHPPRSSVPLCGAEEGAHHTAIGSAWATRPRCARVERAGYPPRGRAPRVLVRPGGRRPLRAVLRGDPPGRPALLWRERCAAGDAGRPYRAPALRTDTNTHQLRISTPCQYG